MGILRKGMKKQKKIVLFGILLVAFFILMPNVWAQMPAVNEIQGLVRVTDLDPNIVVDLRYATNNNFTHQQVYPTAVCLLRKETAQKLAEANAEFMKDGYRIKIWDAYRPPSVQEILWNIMPDERYVAPPSKGGSRHNRGGAVDMTLVDAQGRELEMPTGFDDFTPKAAPSSKVMSRKARKNVDYLNGIMSKHGFKQYENEWWHFDDVDWRSYPLVDVPFEKFTAAAPSQPSSAVPGVLFNLNKDVHQALVVEEILPGSSHAQLTAWEWNGGQWQKAFPAMNAMLGNNGLVAKGEKIEGDGKTPSGIFKLGTAFGYALTVPTKLGYRQVTDKDVWVDDPDSPQYNQWVSDTPQAKSFEKMKRDDDLYKYGVVIEYNTDPIVLGKGSAIFLHVWRNGDSPTSGCVALAEENVQRILSWLDQSAKPVIILGTDIR